MFSVDSLRLRMWKGKNTRAYERSLSRILWRNREIRRCMQTCACVYACENVLLILELKDRKVRPGKGKTICFPLTAFSASSWETLKIHWTAVSGYVRVSRFEMSCGSTCLFLLAERVKYVHDRKMGRKSTVPAAEVLTPATSASKRPVRGRFIWAYVGKHIFRVNVNSPFLLFHSFVTAYVWLVHCSMYISVCIMAAVWLCPTHYDVRMYALVHSRRHRSCRADIL